MRNWIKFYSTTSESHKIAVDVWSRTTRYGEYKTFCIMAKVKPLSEKQFQFILRMCDKQHWNDYKNSFDNSSVI